MRGTVTNNEGSAPACSKARRICMIAWLRLLLVTTAPYCSHALPSIARLVTISPFASSSTSKQRPAAAPSGSDTLGFPLVASANVSLSKRTASPIRNLAICECKKAALRVCHWRCVAVLSWGLQYVHLALVATAGRTGFKP